MTNRIFKNDGTDTLVVNVSVPLSFARLCLIRVDSLDFDYMGLTDSERVVIEGAIADFMEAMNDAA